MVLPNISLLPAELKAIEEHKRFMSERDGRTVSIEEALEDFLRDYRNDWLKDKQRMDNEEQIREIERHKWLVSEKRGYDIGSYAASTDWIEKYARIWRSYKESLESNGFLELKVLLEGDEGFRLRRGSLFLELVSCFQCDFYVHSRNMEYYNLVMNGKEYLHVGSVLAIAELYVPKGEVVEFIATGKEAAEAIETVGKLIRGRRQR